MFRDVPQYVLILPIFDGGTNSQMNKNNVVLFLEGNQTDAADCSELQCIASLRLSEF
jgi:hypothetical protein